MVPLLSLPALNSHMGTNGLLDYETFTRKQVWGMGRHPCRRRFALMPPLKHFLVAGVS